MIKFWKIIFFLKVSIFKVISNKWLALSFLAISLPLCLCYWCFLSILFRCSLPDIWVRVRVLCVGLSCFTCLWLSPHCGVRLLWFFVLSISSLSLVLSVWLLVSSIVVRRCLSCFFVLFALVSNLSFWSSTLVVGLFVVALIIYFWSVFLLLYIIYDRINIT